MSKPIATALVDAVASVLLILSARYLVPADVQLVRDLVLALQPVAVVLIGAMVYSEKVKADTAIKLQSLALAHNQTLSGVKSTHRELTQ